MIRLCIATQTPPTRPIGAQRPAPSTEWRLGRDYIPNVGGVVPMMRALLRTAQGRWVTPHSRWVALGSSGLPEEFETDEGYVVETVPLEPEVRAAGPALQGRGLAVVSRAVGTRTVRVGRLPRLRGLQPPHRATAPAPAWDVRRLLRQ